MKRLIKGLKRFKYMLYYPYGQDPEYDKQCNKSFMRFLDMVDNFICTVFVIVSIISFYMLVTKGLM